MIVVEDVRGEEYNRVDEREGDERNELPPLLPPLWAANALSSGAANSPKAKIVGTTSF